MNNDTIVAFTKRQARILDVYRIEAEEKASKYLFLEKRVEDCENLNSETESLDSKLEANSKDLKDLKNLVVVEVDKQKKDNEKLTKKVERKNTWIKILAGGFITTLSLLVVALTL